MGKEESAYLKELLDRLHRADETLQYSYQKCLAIDIKSQFNQEEQDRFEALTSKYARLSDLIIKQAIKLIDILDLDEAPETIRDAINRAEKKGLISSAEQFVLIRKLRNRIAHEYAESEEDITDIYIETLRTTPLLFDSVKRINAYAEKFTTIATIL